ncbi:MAG TPA: membrane protein insertion efficiency factor YidD [Candidatus Dojkabacteria bacterium]|nr:membrane protein insertion efficiency factor YidD [Candidatus Dojkabacteria bacterium]
MTILFQLPRKVELLVIRGYQKTLSLDQGYLGKIYPNTRACKFTPTCSEYGYDSVKRFGIFKGNYLAIKRVLRCNPWSTPGQYDPVPEK